MQELAGSLQSLCWASAAVGGVASAYFSGAGTGSRPTAACVAHMHVCVLVCDDRSSLSQPASTLKWACVRHEADDILILIV